jgi:hypothetical protein
VLTKLQVNRRTAAQIAAIEESPAALLHQRADFAEDARAQTCGSSRNRAAPGGVFRDGVITR